jgi:bloom syndrome protein
LYCNLLKYIFQQINAESLSGELAAGEVKRIYADIGSSSPNIKLLYVTPEKISASAVFQEILDTMYNRKTLARIVIDEAHCVSVWGHDFRPDYKKLGQFRKRFPNVPVMALTATATPRVRIDVVNQLGIRNCKWFLCSFNRPNLKYIVSPKTGPKTLTDIIALIKSKFMRVSGIIYCFSRKDCDSTASKLKTANIKAVGYHAGMKDKDREQVQKDWLTDKYQVICATIAFGMGIDKPDVRYVIHFSLPKSIEGYYQESGRAGRDGKFATCILYYNYGDKIKYMNFFQGELNLNSNLYRQLTHFYLPRSISRTASSFNEQPRFDRQLLREHGGLPSSLAA